MLTRMPLKKRVQILESDKTFKGPSANPCTFQFQTEAANACSDITSYCQYASPSPPLLQSGPKPTEPVLVSSSLHRPLCIMISSLHEPIIWGWLYNSVKVLKVTELTIHSEMVKIVCYVHFITLLPPPHYTHTERI